MDTSGRRRHLNGDAKMPSVFQATRKRIMPNTRGLAVSQICEADVIIHAVKIINDTEGAGSNAK
jgi:hypothetical protein